MGFFSGFGSAILGGLGTILGGKRASNDAAAARGLSTEQFLLSRFDAKSDYFRDLEATLGGSVGWSDPGNNGAGATFTRNPNHEVWTKGLDVIGRERDLEFSGKGMRQAFDVGKEYGLTPQEVAGSPVPGGTSTSGGNSVLGQSGAAAAAARTETQNRAADRRIALETEALRSKTALGVAAINAGVNFGGNILGSVTDRRGQDINAETQRRGQSVQQKVALIAAEAGKYNARQIAGAQIASAKIQQTTALIQLQQKKLVDAAQIQNIAAQTALALQDKGIKATLHNERWERLFSTMSSENVMASTIAVLNGVDIKSVLQGLDADDATKDQLREFIRHVTSKDSYVFRELQGITGSIKDTGNAVASDWRSWFK